MIQRPHNRKGSTGIGIKNLTANAPVKIVRKAGVIKTVQNVSQKGSIGGTPKGVRQVP